ncbi:unnamed protein product [Linum trigynum]|uniref:Uncharacterized protein n=1 Tax=Linum trigynum TaxID=586398 RepID=A0AAV2DWR8_9ROSI
MQIAYPSTISIGVSRKSRGEDSSVTICLYYHGSKGVDNDVKTKPGLRLPQVDRALQQKQRWLVEQSVCYHCNGAKAVYRF